MTEFSEVMYALRHWMESKDISTKGARLEITVPESQQVAKLEYYVRNDPHLRLYWGTRSNTQVTEVQGIKVRFDIHERPKW